MYLVAIFYLDLVEMEGFHKPESICNSLYKEKLRLLQICAIGRHSDFQK